MREDLSKKLYWEGVDPDFEIPEPFQDPEHDHFEVEEEELP